MMNITRHRNKAASRPLRPVVLRVTFLAIFLAGLGISQPGFAEKKPAKITKPAAPATPTAPVIPRLKPVLPNLKPVSAKFKEDFQKYCANNSDLVSDAKFAWQAKTIADMEVQLQQVIERLEAKQKEYQTWVVRRENFISRMTASLVKIYSTMEPESAAAQIAIVDYDTAVSILTKLKPREASAILNEMDPVRASQLVKVIVGAIAVDEKKETN